MTIVVESAAPGQRAPLKASRVQALVKLALAAQGVRSASISVTFLSRAAMARLNREQLGHRGATDIITFEHARPSDSAPVTGDVYICADIARENAKAWHVPAREELARLVIHGALHTLGFTHPTDETRTTSPMWRAQEKYLRAARRRGVV